MAAKHLARPLSSVVTICGCGNQGRVQLATLLQVLPITQVYAFDAMQDAAKRFAADMSDLYGIPVAYELDLGKAARQSHAIATGTPSKQRYLPKGARPTRDLCRSGWGGQPGQAGVGADSARGHQGRGGFTGSMRARG